jgi:hypothetical protein
MDLSYAQIKRLYKKKKYRFSVGACGGFNWACVCRYEVERVAAPLMILSVKPVDHKNKGNQNRKREICLSYP